VPVSGFFTAPFAILSLVRMRVLFIISIAALAALLWASISIMQHIRRAHQKNREGKQKTQAEDLNKL
jgi:predicted histidine transporter YuiF (NhaC family)